MAIKKSITLNINYGVSDTFNGALQVLMGEGYEEIQKKVICPNAYIVVDKIIGDKAQVEMICNTYLDSSKQNILYKKRYTFEPNIDNNSSNFIKQGYDYLKTLPEYVDAIDVLEDGQML